jgi:integrase
MVILAAPQGFEPLMPQAQSCLGTTSPATSWRLNRSHISNPKLGSLLIQAGVSPAYVQKQMGHRSIQVTTKD